LEYFKKAQAPVVVSLSFALGVSGFAGQSAADAGFLIEPCPEKTAANAAFSAFFYP
jgi:hypothetical protein